jgi:regulator of sigma E protease
MILLTILIFALLLSVLVFVHELGHFVVAVRNGIKAEEFGFGFPPRAIGIVKNDETGKWNIVKGNADVHPKNTIYSLNWIPFGGFVRMKGEDGAEPGQDSFASKSAWVRIKVLAAGVFMNFVLAWVLISTVLLIGFPQMVGPENRPHAQDIRVQILAVAKDTPAETMGLKQGDIILAVDGVKEVSMDETRNAILLKKGEVIKVTVDRSGKQVTLSGTPRTDYPADQGALGISFAETAIMSYSWLEAPIEGAKATYNTTLAILDALGTMVKNLFIGKGSGADVTGPVGIVVLTKQMSDLGIAYLLQFAALLSINLGIFNILPIPALDGGRIFFILIEKLKGRPVSQRIEGGFHQIGFILLLLLMAWVTVKDVAQFNILEKLGHLF